MKSILSLREADTQEVKESLRQEMRSRRARLTVEQRTRASHAASRHLLGLPELSGDLARGRSGGQLGALADQPCGDLAGAIIAVYAAIQDEASPAHAVAALCQDNTLVYPRVCRGQAILCFHRVHDPAELMPSSFGVPEPTAGHPELALEHIDMIVVPGLAFDERGGRLGWGKGHYDATLAHSPALRVGFAFQCQVIAEVPVDAHDASMDLLVTETGALRISARARGPARPTNSPS